MVVVALPVSVDDVADYIIAKCAETDTYLNVLKLHKLVYYVQAWYLVFSDGNRAINTEFQAWIHGPVSRPLYDRFRERKSMYYRLTRRDIRPGFSVHDLPEAIRSHIDIVLEVYAELSDDQLEEMTHKEEPWIQARGDCSPRERCETPISEVLMKTYYGLRIAKA